MATSKKVSEERLPYNDEISYAMSDAGIIHLFGEIGQAAHVNVEIGIQYHMVKSPKKPINIILSSPGGSVIHGLAIHDVIKHFAQKIPINITVNGSAMSMAVPILQAATKRLSYPNSQFLLHEVSYGNAGSLTSHDDEFENARKLQQRVDDILIARSGIKQADLTALIKRRDYGFTAQEALKHNLIDSII